MFLIACLRNYSDSPETKLRLAAIDLYKKVDVSRFAEENPKAQSWLLVLSFFKAKRSQYYGKFEANFSIYRPNEFSYSS
jgi:hypothetical protein